MLIKSPFLLGIDIQNDIYTFLKVKKLPKLRAGERRGGGIIWAMPKRNLQGTLFSLINQSLLICCLYSQVPRRAGPIIPRHLPMEPTFQRQKSKQQLGHDEDFKLELEAE